MKLTPVYHTQNPAYRVIYRPGHSWVAQRLSEHKSTREFDPWIDLGKPKPTCTEAIVLMHQHKPLLPTKTVQHLNQ